MTVEIPEKFILEVTADHVYLDTSSNGDIIRVEKGKNLKTMHLTAEQAATLSWIINHQNATLEIEIKIKEE